MMDLSLLRISIDDVFKRRRSSIMSLPSIDRFILKTIMKMDNCWIAGGAALALYTGDMVHIKDWDIFGDPSSMVILNSILREDGFKKVGISEFGITYEKAGVLVQLITYRYPESVEEIFAEFDFTVCCFAIEKEHFCYFKSAEEDVLTKTINLIRITNLSASIKRIARYGAKGFTPSDSFVEGLSSYIKGRPIKFLMKELDHTGDS